MNLKNFSLLLLIVLCPTIVSAQKYLSKESPEIEMEWKSHIFFSTKTFAENIGQAPEFSMLSKVLKDKALSEALGNEEMITVFAITDEGFSKLDKKQRDSIMGDKNQMASIVKFLTIPGRIDRHGLQTAVKKHDGKAYLATLNGENLGVTEKDGKLYLVGSKGRLAAIVGTNFYHKNGLFHIVDGIVFPTSKK